MAFQMLAIIFIGVFGGVKLDKYLGFQKPIFTVLFSLASVVLAIYQMVKDLLRKNK